MKIAIIGAGAAGLAAAKNLGTCHTITVFEALPSLAGVWAVHASAPCQPIYEELRTNIPIDLMAFWDFPFDANDKRASTGDFPEAEVVRAYLARYADHFKLAPLIQFDRRVVSVEKISDGWQVQLDSNEICCFDAVVVCNGHYHQPFFPAVPGLEDFHGRATHSANFVRGVDHRKETVVIWGGHASGTDLVRLIAPHAKQVFWSGHAPTMADATSDLSNVQCCADIERFEDERVVLTDGETVTGIDRVIFCTGYQYDFPFLSKSLLHHDGFQLTQLYRDLLHVDHPTLAFVGIPSLIIPFPLFDIQSRWLNALWSGNLIAPSSEDQRTWLLARDQAFAQTALPPRAFHRLGERQMHYLTDLLSEAGGPPMPDWFASAAKAAQSHRLRYASDYRDQPFNPSAYPPPS